MKKSRREQSAQQGEPGSLASSAARSGTKKKNRTWLYVIMMVVLLAAVFFGFKIWYDNGLKPKDASSTQKVYVEIPEGSNISETAEILYDKGIIRNAMVFESYAGRHSYGGAEVQAALYELSPSMPVSEVFTKLTTGDAYVGEMKTVTVPEGKNLKEVAQIVQDAGISTADQFIAEASKVAEYQEHYSILSSIPADKVSQRTLEGYLFPDTYTVALGDTTDGSARLVDAMLSRFSEKFTEDMIKHAKETDRTVDDVVILASIVEMETKLPEDRADAASVFYNRMKQNMPLQSDITIDYIYGTKTPVLTTEQTQVDSPYNTYIHTGLPLGPISNPGIASLEATLYPSTTDYLFFVADMSTGKLHYNTTLEGHNADVATYMGS